MLELGFDDSGFLAVYRKEINKFNSLVSNKYKYIIYPVWGAKVESKVSFRPWAILSWMEISVPRVLSVFHFSVKVKPD
jgi:hypothetical protein